VTPGGGSATVVALNKNTGEPVWRCAVPEGDSASYASAVLATLGGKREVVQFLSGGVVGINAADGKFLWRYAKPGNRTCNAAAPIVSGDMVFASSAYNTGGGLARITAGGTQAEEVYFNRAFQNHHGGMVLLDGYVYGAAGSNLTCIDLKTGQKKWEDRSVGKGSLTYAEGNLYYRSENGPVALVEANSEKYVEKGRFEQPERSRASARLTRWSRGAVFTCGTRTTCSVTT